MMFDHLCLGIYRTAFLCLPRTIRRNHRGAMEAVFEELLRAAKGSGRIFARLRLTGREVGDLLKTGVAARIGGGKGHDARSGGSAHADGSTDASGEPVNPGAGPNGPRRGGGGFWGELRIATRQLARRPAFTGVVILTLTLGIGATTAIFSILHAVLLDPLPFPDPDRMVTLWMSNPNQGIEKDVTSYPNFADWRAQNSTFEGVSIVTGGSATLNEPGSSPTQVRASWVTGDFFTVLGVEAALGRVLRPEENQSGAPATVVVSHRFWSDRMGGDPGALGSDLRLDGVPYTVVGVLPPGAGYPLQAELWRPLQLVGPFEGIDDDRFRGSLQFTVVGRIRADASFERAQADMNEVAAGLRDLHPVNAGTGITLERLEESIVGDTRTPLLLLMGAVGFVLLVVCANVANLLLARGAARSSEVAVRRAMGARSGTVARQVLVESLLLAVVGGVLGVLVAFLGVGLLESSLNLDLPRFDGARINGPVLGFAVAVSGLVSVIFGTVPAVQAMRVQPAEVLRSETRGAGGGAGSVRRLLVSLQFGLAIVLLAGAGLMTRTLMELRAVDTGFDAENVLTFRVTLPGQAYPGPDRRQEFWDRLMPELEALPGVEAAGGIQFLLLGRLPQSAPIVAEGNPSASDADNAFPVAFDVTMPGFFETVGVDLVSGRMFDRADVDGPVAVVNQALAERFFPHRDPVGGRFTFGDPTDEDTTWIQVIGVAEDVRRSGLDRPARPAIYFPYPQNSPGRFTLAVRTSGDPLAVVPDVRAAVARLDGSLPISNVETLEAGISDTLARQKLIGVLLGIFSGMALVLAAVGIYGVTAYGVDQRRGEIGIRLALGAKKGDVLRTILGSALTQVGIGMVFGLVAALLLGRFVEGLLFQVSPTDPVTLILVSGTLAAVALLSAYLPALRAARLDPAQTLRRE